MRKHLPLALACLLSLTATAAARAPATDTTAAIAREQQVAQLLQRYATRPPLLRALLQAMPKGGDLHNHLAGSVYAEDYLQWAGEEGYCLQPLDYALLPPPCTAEQTPVRGLQRQPLLYAKVVDALSLRNYVPGQPQFSGHERFFSTFGKFGVFNARRAEAMVATLEQAARDHVGYVEIITNPPQVDQLGQRAQQLPWQPADLAGNFARLRAELPALVKAAQDDSARLDAQVREQLRCDTAEASPACAVEYRYIAYALRTLPQPVVFAQMALAHALVAAGGSRFAGVNIVAPEDYPVARNDYRAHMAMFGYFAEQYPGVPLSLHAGELSLGLVPPADLRFHIAAAVDVGAARIGHGVDIAYEDQSAQLLRRMRERGVAVEVNLTSNDVILGVKGAEHPLPMYLQAGVPVVLSTDDEGVSRIDLTHEYQRAVREHGLDYLTLKRIARNGLSYAFVPGQSLWTPAGRALPACAAALAKADPGVPGGDCAALLERSAKARLQWQLERDFARFERQALENAL
jgi:adenosine deaminase